MQFKQINLPEPKKEIKPAKAIRVPKSKPKQKDSGIAIVHENYSFQTQSNSIAEFMAQLNKDARALILNVGYSMIRAKSGLLEIVLLNKYRVRISPAGVNTKRYIIYDDKGKMLTNQLAKN